MKNKKNTVLVIDAGGRGSALVHKYSQSPKVSRVIAIPGNDLMQINSKVQVKTFPKLKTTSIKEILKIAKTEKADLVDVAQDNAVEAGLSDLLIENGFNVVGPSRLAGQIEWDKAWSRDFMKKYKLPIPEYKIFNSVREAEIFIKKRPEKKWFIKASGLAEGKGVIPGANLEESLKAIKQMSKLGKSGKTFVVEEWLEGEEFSMFAVTDGINFTIVGCAQDHKRLYDGDLGPNTGGVGCSAPPLIVSKSIYSQGKKIIRKTLSGLQKEKRSYKGVLYLGAMAFKGKVFVIEFNARWGSPEAEVLMPGVKSDIFDIGMQIADGKLKTRKVKIDGLARVGVTGSLRPGIENKRRELFGLEEVLKMKDVIVYGTRISRESSKYYVSSGRLFHLVASGKNVIDARRKAYSAMSTLFVEGNNLHYRTDIGWRDAERLYP
jgi:phosphoribosylamine---glycine ligase